MTVNNFLKFKTTINNADIYIFSKLKQSVFAQRYSIKPLTIYEKTKQLAIIKKKTKNH